MTSLKENTNTNYVDLEKIISEVEEAKMFQKYKWPIIDVSRKSVEETAASVIKIYEISKKMFRIILASKSKVRLDILKNNKIDCIAVPSNIDEEVKIDY